MRRALSLWLATWATDLVWRRIRRPGPTSPSESSRREGRPVILLTERIGSREVIARRCAAAATLGVSPGMDLSHARALIPAVLRAHVEEHQPEKDAAALRRLADWALRYSPVVSLDPPDGLLLDATGLAHLYGREGEAGLSRALGLALTRRGYAVRIAVADSYVSAWALARFGRQSVTHVEPGKDREALAPLPVAGLGLDPATQAACEEVGLSTIGSLFDLPRASVASQFGEALLSRLDRALGLAPETVEGVRLETPPRAELIFEGPNDRWEALEAAAGQSLDQLCAQLAARGLGTRRIELEVFYPREPRRAGHVVQLGAASGCRAHLWAMLRPVLDRVDIRDGVEGVALVALDLARLAPRQADFGVPEGADEAGAEWNETVDLLVSRLGAENVLRYELVESYLPERAFIARDARQRPARSTGAPVERDRPTRLFSPSYSAAVMLRAPDGPILHLRWDGRHEDIIRCLGPERIGAEWWRSSLDAAPSARSATRDYFKAQTRDGTWLWVVRLETGQWFVQGDWA